MSRVPNDRYGSFATGSSEHSTRALMMLVRRCFTLFNFAWICALDPVQECL